MKMEDKMDIKWYRNLDIPIFMTTAPTEFDFKL